MNTCWIVSKSLLTFFGGPEAVVPRHVLDVVDERRVRQQLPVLVDLVDGVLEGQLDARILLVLGKYSPCNKMHCSYT